MELNLANILATTAKGLLLYRFVFKETFPRKDILSLIAHGRSLPNPFLPGSRLLIQLRDGIYCHQDLQQPAFKGTAIDFANKYFKAATLPELYYLINQNLGLGLKIPSEDLLDQLQKAEENSDYPRFSFFQPPISNTRPTGSLNLPELFKMITSNYQKETEAFRELKDPQEARQYKANHFPYVTFAGCFERRSDKALLSPSGLLVIDLDDLEEVAPLRDALIADSEFETQLLFVSPSGKGLKWVTSYQHLEISHLEYFRLLSDYLEAVFGLKPDPSGKDISRACFTCYDPDAVLNGKYLFGGERREESG